LPWVRWKKSPPRSSLSLSSSESESREIWEL
jgi:hypothetical protein